jgi:uncharacterized membrane protein YbhN (UPF0104 family)
VSASLVVPLALLALVPLASVELAKTWRWAVLFGPQRPPFARALRAEVAGQLANALAPVRAGELVRLGLVRAEGSQLVPATAAVLAAKAVDSLCLAAIGVVVAGTQVFRQAAWGVVGGAAVIALVVALMAAGPRILGLMERAGHHTWAVRLAPLLEVVVGMRNQRAWLTVGGATAVVWSAGLAANAIVLVAVGVSPGFDLAARMLIAGYLVGFLPAPPARIGVFEAGITVALTSAGVGLPEALAAGVVLHVCQFAELGLLLAFGLAERQWSWRA